MGVTLCVTLDCAHNIHSSSTKFYAIVWVGGKRHDVPFDLVATLTLWNCLCLNVNREDIYGHVQSFYSCTNYFAWERWGHFQCVETSVHELVYASSIRLWNGLDIDIKSRPSLDSFNYNFKKGGCNTLLLTMQGFRPHEIRYANQSSWVILNQKYNHGNNENHCEKHIWKYSTLRYCPSIHGIQ